MPTSAAEAPADDFFLTTGRAGMLGGVLYVVSAVVTVTSLLLPSPPAIDRGTVVLVAAVGLVLGGVFLLLPWEQWPRAASFWLAAVPAQALIGFHNNAGGDDPYRYGLFFMVCFAWVGLTQARWTTLKLVPFTAVAYIAPLFVHHRPAWAWASALYALPIFVLAGETTAWVADSLRDAHAALAVRALRDVVTGLPNRAELHARARMAAARAARNDTLVAVLFVDLDRFKPVNDTFGHDAGDEVLRSVADRLQSLD